MTFFAMPDGQLFNVKMYAQIGLKIKMHSVGRAEI